MCFNHTFCLKKAEFVPAGEREKRKYRQELQSAMQSSSNQSILSADVTELYLFII